MKNKKGQSLIDVVFSMGIVVLVLTGVVVLIVSTAKIKRLAFERKKAVELSQKIIETEIKTMKDNPLSFWSLPKDGISDLKNLTDDNFTGYTYDINYDCSISGNSNDRCDVTFTVNWGDGKELKVNRFFSRQGT